MGLHSGKQAEWNALCGRDREKLVPGFTKKYDVSRLVYFEQHDSITIAIQREKNIKHWSREWKIDLIRSMNLDWRDLWHDIVR